MPCVGFVQEGNHSEPFESGRIAWLVLVMWREVDILYARESGRFVLGRKEGKEESDKRRDASVVYRNIFLAICQHMRKEQETILTTYTIRFSQSTFESVDERGVFKRTSYPPLTACWDDASPLRLNQGFGSATSIRNSSTSERWAFRCFTRSV